MTETRTVGLKKNFKQSKNKKKLWEKGNSCITNPVTRKFRSQTTFDDSKFFTNNSEFITENLVELLKTHFPDINLFQTKFNFDANAETLYKIIIGLRLTQANDINKSMVQLFLNKKDYVNDPQLCACVMLLFDGINFTNIQNIPIISIIKVISIILDRFKQNLEVISLAFKISQKIFAEYTHTLPQDVIEMFILDHTKLILSQEKDVRRLVLNLFETNETIISSSSEYSMTDFFIVKLRNTRNIRIMNSLMRLALVYAHLKNSSLLLLARLNDVLSLSSYTEEIMLLKVISNNLSKFGVFNFGLKFLFDMVYQLEMHLSEEYAVIVTLTIFMHIFDHLLEIQRQKPFLELLEFFHNLFRHKSDKVRFLANQKLVYIFENLNPETVKSNWFVCDVSDTVRHHLSLLAIEYDGWEYSHQILRHYLNFMTKQTIFDDQKVILSQYFGALHECRNSTNISHTISIIDDIISCLISFTGVELFFTDIGITTNQTADNYYSYKWAFEIILGLDTGFKINDFLIIVDIFKVLYTGRYSLYGRGGDEDLKKLYCSFYTLIFSILVKYSAVVDITFVDAYIFEDILKEIISSDLNLRNGALILLSNLKVIEKNTNSSISEYIPLLFDEYLKINNEKNVRKNLLKAIKSVFDNFPHFIPEEFHCQILKNKSDSCTDNFQKYNNLANCCLLYFSSQFAIKLVNDILGSPDIAKKSNLRMLRNLINNLTSPRCRCCTFASHKNSWFTDLVLRLNEIIADRSFKHHSLILDILQILQPHLEFNDVLNYIDYMCVCLFEPNSKHIKKSKILITSIIKNHVIDDDFIKIFAKKLILVHKNPMFKFGAVYLTSVFLKCNKTDLKESILAKLMNECLESITIIGKRGYKSILVSFIQCLDHLPYDSAKSFYFKIFVNPKYLNDCKVMDKFKHMVKLSNKYLEKNDREELKNGCEIFKKLHRASEKQKPVVNNDSDYEFDEYESLYSDIPFGIIKKNKDEEIIADFDIDSSGKIIIQPLGAKTNKRVHFDLPDEISENIEPTEKPEVDNDIQSDVMTPIQTFEPGHEYRATKARGDRKLKNKPDPYAFVPLNRRILAKPNQKNIFKGIVKSKNRFRRKK